MTAPQLPPTPEFTPGMFSTDPASPPLPSSPSSESAVTSELRAALERARGEFNLRHYGTVKSILNDLDNKLKPYLDNLMPANEAFSNLIQLIKASALCLYGRLTYYLGATEESATAFDQSVSLFERQNLAWVRENKRILTDYAIALSRIDRTGDAFVLLKEICESGLAPHEAFGYLGYAYQLEGNFEEAELIYRKGLQLAPGDPKILQYLAETLEKLDNSEATATYCDAALAAISLEDTQTATELVNHALNITPTDTEALNIAYGIAHKRQDMESSMAIVDEVLRHNTQHAWALGLKATLLRESGKLDDAINILKEIPISTPDLAWILVEYARVLHQANPNDGEKALRQLDLACDLNPMVEGTAYLRAEILIDQGKPTEAVELLRRAVENEPQNLLLAHELGRALFLAQDTEGALKVFEDTLASNPKSIEALVGKAVTLSAQGKYDQALDSLRRASRLAPENDIVLRLMVDCLLDNDRIEDALEELDSKIQNNPQNPTYYYWKKGQILLKQNSPNASEALEQAASLNPDNPDIQLDLAKAWCQINEYAKAGEAYDLAIRHASPLFPTYLYAIGNKAFYLSQIAAFQEALDLISPFTENSGQAWLWSIQGWCLQHLGDRSSIEKARDSYKQACMISKEEKEEGMFQKGLANTLCELGQREEAKKLFEEIIERQKFKQGNEAEILQLLGWCHYRLERYDEGMRLLQQAVFVDEEPITVRFDLALTMLAGSRSSLALSEYQGAMEMASKQHILRQRGLYYIALFDLVEAAKAGRIGGPEGTEVFNALRARLEASGLDLTTIEWLGDNLPSRVTS